MHKDDEIACREYLMNNKPYQLFNCLGSTFKSRLVNLTLEDNEFKHLDYYPMVNARAHLVGDLEHWTQ